MGTRAAMDSLLAALARHDIRHVYSMDSMLQWNIMFASGGGVTARWLDSRDRRPEFPRAVDCAAARGERVAFVGRVAQLDRGASSGAIEIVGEEYFLVPDPPPGSLAAYGFALTDCRRE
jgi:hypothetical protein